MCDGEMCGVIGYAASGPGQTSDGLICSPASPSATLSLPVNTPDSAARFLEGLGGDVVGAGYALNRVGINAPTVRAVYKREVESMVAEIARRLESGQAIESVAEWASGERSRIISRVRNMSGYGTRILYSIRDRMQYGARIWNASDEELPRVIGEELGGLVGGAVGAGMGVGACIIFGIATSGWGLLACGVVGGVGGGVAGSYVGGGIAEGIYYSDAQTPQEMMGDITLEIPEDSLHQRPPPQMCH